MKPMKMSSSLHLIGLLVIAGLAVTFASVASAQQPVVSIAGAPCVTPPVMH